jgi:hypothetical protein
MFPLVALFHIIMLAYSIWNAHTEPLSSIIWLQPLWMVAYTISWLFVCDLRRWAAYSYMILTAVNLTLFAVHITDYGSALFLMDIVFSFFILVYIKKFE